MQNQQLQAEIAPLGVDGLTIRFGQVLSEPANRAALALRAALDGAGFDGVEESSTALTSVYLRFRGVARAVVLAQVQTLVNSRDWSDAPLPEGRRLWRVPTVFGGPLAPQLDTAAAQAGVSAAQAIAEICAAPLRVQTIGFAPGQPYLGPLPAHWDISRQSTLTPQVPVGALVVAIRQMVLFSVTTPTGWQHVGQTALRLFQPDAPDPFLLRPGDEVLFASVPAETYARLQADPLRGGATCESLPT
ncbi:MAG: 5-oxoprolinase subunit B family protein [Roseinatronobacter sp.]